MFIFPVFLVFVCTLQHTPKFMIFLNIKQHNIISFPCIFLLPWPSDINLTLYISTKYVVSKVPKLFYLRWICHKISPHIICWKIFDLCILFFKFICHKKVTNIQRPASLTCTTFTNNLQYNLTLVVLIQYVLDDLVPLSFNK